MNEDDTETIAGLGVNPPATIASPPPPKIPKKGVYRLEAGDTPGTVSVKIFGRGHMAVPLVRANPGAEWVAGTEITIP